MGSAVRRAVMIGLAALVVGVGAIASPEEAVAKKKQKSGALMIIGTTNKQFSCEGKLYVQIAYNVKGQAPHTTSVLLSRKGGWSIDLPRLEPGGYFISAKLTGHPVNTTAEWPLTKVKVKNNKHSRLVMEQIHIDSC